jgi:FAD/FMN-containing dehydrogenase
MLQEMLQALEPFVYDWTCQKMGSVSAEHGIGALKQHVLNRSQSTLAISLMRQIKSLFDPHNILNPGKVLPPIDA